MQTSPSRHHRSPPAQVVQLEDRMTGSNPVSPSSSGSPASSGGMSPLHFGNLMNDSLDGSPGFETPRLQTRASVAYACGQWDSQHNQTPRGPKSDKSQSDILEQARHEAKIENRIAELKKEGFWSTRRLSKVPEPIRPKVHWDYLCEEMQWLAADFAQERRWKRGVARKVARMVIRHHEDLKQKEDKAKREEQAKLRRIASFVAKEVRQFWTNVEKVVQFKQQSRLEEKRKKTLDLQLDFIVGQTEKYSDLLTQSLNETLAHCKTDSSRTASTASSPLNSAGAREDEDGDFQPQEEDDDEETIEVEEQQDGNDLETQQREIEQLKRESELPLEELLQTLPQQILASSCSEDNVDEDDDEEEEEDDDDDEGYKDEVVDEEEPPSKILQPLEKTSLVFPGKEILCNHDEDDEEFTANEEEAEDEEETIEAEEALDVEVDHAAELDQLVKEGDMPIAELLQRYSEVQTEKSESLSGSTSLESEQSDEEDENDEEDEDEEDEDEEEIDQSDSSAMDEDEDDEEESEAEEEENEEEDIGVEYLLKGFDNNEGGHTVNNSSRVDSLGPKKEITDIAATAESLQPKGYTLATAQVKTPVPFLLRGTLREYQHIGLDWLVTMYEKKLNGILADEMGLGKTIQTISLLAHLAIEKGNWGPHLIIVPTSVMLNWEMELKRWCPSFKILTYYGSQKERKLKRQGWTKPNAFHVCITSYKLVLQDHQAFRRKNWKYLILDEAQNIKNFKSQRWQSLLRFNSQRRLLLTGTPLQNSLMELWSLMHFLMPHVFQSHREFKEWFSNPLTGMIEGSQEYNEGLIKRLHKVLRPFLLRRVKVDVEKQMPKKYEHVIHCRLSKRQRYLYDDFMAQAATRETLASGHFMSVINILMQLRKVCNHPNLFDPRPIHSPFITEGICFTTASLALRALERDPFKDVDLDIFDLINLEGRISRYEADSFLPQMKASRILIEEIAESPDPPPRPKPVKMKVNRMFQPVPKPEGRPVVLVNSPRASAPLQRTPVPAAIEMSESAVPPVVPVPPVIPVPPVVPVAPILPVQHAISVPPLPDTAQVLPAVVPPQVPLAVSASIPLPPPTRMQPPTAFMPAMGLNNTSAATTTVTSLLGPVSTPQVLPTTPMTPNHPRAAVPPVPTQSSTSGIRGSPLPPAAVRMPPTTLNPGPIGGMVKPTTVQTTTAVPGYSFSGTGTVQQRLLLSPDMQARLPSGEVISIAQLASLANRPIQNMPGTKPITFQLHGNRLTLSGPHLRQMAMAQPRQLQGNVVHLVSAGGQHHIISQPAHMALLQAMAQQQPQLQQPQPQLQLQQGGQAQPGVQTMSLQAVPTAQQPAMLPNSVPGVAATPVSTGINVPFSAAQASLMSNPGMVKIVVRQAPRDGVTAPGIHLPQRQAGLPAPGIPTLLSPMQRGTMPGTPFGPTAVRFPAPPPMPVRAPNPQPAVGRPMLRVLQTQVPSMEQTAAVTCLGPVAQAPSTCQPFASLPASSTTPTIGTRLLTSTSSPVSTISSQPLMSFSNPGLSLASSSATTPLPHSLSVFSSTTPPTAQPPTSNPALVQIPTCSLASASRPLTTAALLPTTLISTTSSSACVAALPISDPASTAGPPLSLRLTAENSALTPPLWPLTSTVPILASSPFSSPVPMPSPTLASVTAPIPSSTLASSSINLQAPPPSPSLASQLVPTSISCSLPLLPPSQASASTLTYGSAPMPSPTLACSQAPMLASTTSAQTTNPVSSPASLLAPVQVTSPAINLTANSIHLQASPLAPLRPPILAPLQASLQTTSSAPLQAPMPASSSALIPASTLVANLLAPVSASSFTYVQCPAPVSSPATLLTPILGSSPTPTLASNSASLLSTNLSPLLVSNVTSTHPSLLAPVSACISAPLSSPYPTFNPTSILGSSQAPLLASVSGCSPGTMVASVPACSPTPILASVSTSSQAPILASVPTSSPAPVQSANPPSSPVPILSSVVATNPVATLGPRTFTLVSNPSPTCVSLTVSYPSHSLGPISAFTTAPILSPRTLGTASSPAQTLVPRLLTPACNTSPILPSTLVPVQTSSPPPALAGRPLMQNIPIAPSQLTKAGVPSAQVCNPSMGTISNSHPVATFGMQLSCSAPNPSTRLTVTSAQIPNQGTVQSPFSVPGNGMQLICSSPNPLTRPLVTCTQIASQGTVQSLVSMPGNGMQLACSPSTLAFTPLTSPSSAALVSPVHTSVSAPCPVPALGNLTSLSDPAPTLSPRPLTSLSVFVNNLAPRTLSSPATTLAPMSFSVSSNVAALTPKTQPVCSPLTTSAAWPLTPAHNPLFSLAAQPSTPASSPLTTSAARPTTPGSSLLPTLAGRPPTPVNSSLTSSESRPLTPVSSSASTLGSRSLTQINSFVATSAGRPLTPINSYLTTTAGRPPTPVNSSLTNTSSQTLVSSSATTLGTRPLTPVYSHLATTAGRAPTPVHSYFTTMASRPLTPVSSSAPTVAAQPLTPVPNSCTTVAARPPAPIANYITTVAGQPLTPIANTFTTVVARPPTPTLNPVTAMTPRPLTPVPSCFTTADTWSLTPVASTFTTSAALSMAPISSTMLTLTPRIQSGMVYKEELETLMFRSTTPTPPPSTSFVMPRIRRQPPPPPRSPFYLESLEERRKRQKLERLDRLFRINERHCAQAPIYGTEILQLCNMSSGMACIRRDGWWGVGYAHCYAAQVLGESKHLDQYWQMTEALSQAILRPQQRMEQLEHLIDRFIFVMPPVEAPAISVHSCHPSPSFTVQQVMFKERLQNELGPRSRCLHRIICNMRTQFPDLRLIQYDCGKLQTLDRLLRQLKAGSHRVLIFTQMTRMLDVLEQFLNYHGHIYLRLDGSTRVEQRQSLMDRFNADKRIFCFILSTRSGGVGVNLTGADTVVFYDSDWNPTMDAQAQDRCHRIGQTRDVHIYRLISERTVEENILKKANQKRMLGDMAIEGGNFTTAYFRQQTIRDLFEMPTDEGTKKEGEGASKGSAPEDEDAATTKQTQILEQALCKAEDEEDIRAATQAKAEQVAELAEFNENIPLDLEDGLGREEEEEISKAEQEIASLVEQLTPIERYAMNFLESSLEDISKEELKQAEEQVEAARKDLDQAKDDIFHLPADEEEGWVSEENQFRKSKKAKAFNRPERPGTRVSERLRGTRIGGMENEEPAPVTPTEHHQIKQESKRLSTGLQEKMQPVRDPLAKQEIKQTTPDGRKLHRAKQSSPPAILENKVPSQRPEANKLLSRCRQATERETFLGWQQQSPVSSMFPERTLVKTELLQDLLNSRTFDTGQLQNETETEIVRKMPLVHSKHSPPETSQLVVEETVNHSPMSKETELPALSQAETLKELSSSVSTASVLEVAPEGGFRNSEAQLQSPDSRSHAFSTCLSGAVGEVKSLTQEAQSCLPLVTDEQSVMTEVAVNSRWAGHQSGNITGKEDHAELPAMLKPPEVMPLETQSIGETVPLSVLCNHLLEESPVQILNSENDQVVDEPSFCLNTTNRDVSDVSKQSESTRHRRHSHSHTLDALPRAAVVERLVSPPDNKASFENSKKCIESFSTPYCDAQQLRVPLQISDGMMNTAGKGTRPPGPTRETHNKGTDQVTYDPFEQPSSAKPTTVTLTSKGDLLKSAMPAGLMMNYVPEEGIPQACQEASIEGADTLRLKETAEEQAIASLVEELKSIPEFLSLAAAAPSPGYCKNVIETEVLHQKSVSPFETMTSKGSEPLSGSMTAEETVMLLADRVHTPPGEVSQTFVNCTEEGKLAPIWEHRNLHLQEEVALSEASIGHLAPAKGLLNTESFGHLEKVLKEVLQPPKEEVSGKVSMCRQHLGEVPEVASSQHSLPRSSKHSANLEDETEVIAATLKECPPRIPRRRTYADGEILRSQKDDSPTAKVLRKLPGRIVTIVEDRVPLKRKRKPHHSQNSSCSANMASPGESSTNSISDAETSSKESAARHITTKRRMGLETKDPMETRQRGDSLDIVADYQQASYTEAAKLLQSPETSNKSPTRQNPEKFCDMSTSSEHFQHLSVCQSSGEIEETTVVSSLSIDNRPAEPQGDSPPPAIKRKRGRPRKIRSYDSLDCRSPDPASPGNSSLELASPNYKNPAPVILVSKSLEETSVGDKAPQSPFLDNLSPEIISLGSMSPLQSPAQETTTLPATSPSTDAMDSPTRSKPRGQKPSVSPKFSQKSAGIEKDKSRIQEIKERKKGSPTKGSPDKVSLVPTDQSETASSFEKCKRGRTGRSPKVQEPEIDLSPLSSSCLSVLESEKSVLPLHNPSSKPMPVSIINTALQPTTITDISSITPQRIVNDNSSTPESISTICICTPTEVSTGTSSTPAGVSIVAMSITAGIATDPSLTPASFSTVASTTPTGISSEISSTQARVSTVTISRTQKALTDIRCTPPKRKRGRPPRIQSPLMGEKCSLPSASEQESSLDETKNLKPPAKKTTRKKRKVRAEEAQRGLRLPHTLAPDKVTSQLSDSETSSSSETPPLTRLAKVKMEAQGTRGGKEMESGSDTSSKVARHSPAPAARTDSDSEVARLSANNRNSDLPDKASGCPICPRAKNDVPSSERVDDTSSQESSASEIRSPRSEDIPRGRCTRQTPSDSVLPTLEIKRHIPRKAKRQSSSESSARQSRTRTDSEADSTSEDDGNRPHKRLKGESGRLRKTQGHTVPSESIAERMLRSVAAAAAVAAMSPASNTRSAAVTSPTPSTSSPTAARKSGPLAITTLGNRGRKPKT